MPQNVYIFQIQVRIIMIKRDNERERGGRGRENEWGEALHRSTTKKTWQFTCAGYLLPIRLFSLKCVQWLLCAREYIHSTDHFTFICQLNYNRRE